MKFYKVPASAQWHEWEKFWRETKKKFPMQYFFRKTIPNFYRRTIRWPADRLMWAIIHRVHPKHRYHVIKPRSLKPGYSDPDIRIQAAAFDELSVYAETKLMGDGIDGTRWTQEDFDYYDVEDQHWGKKEFYEQVEVEKKIIKLRNWWVVERKQRDALEFNPPEGKPEWGEMWVLNKEYEGTPEREAYDKYSQNWWKMEDEWKEEDQKKFHELVDLLPFLWY